MNCVGPETGSDNLASNSRGIVEVSVRSSGLYAGDLFAFAHIAICRFMLHGYRWLNLKIALLITIRRSVAGYIVGSNSLGLHLLRWLIICA